MLSTTRAIKNLLLAVGLATAVIVVTPAAAGAGRPELHRELSEVRRATARYHDPARAIVDGFVPTEACVADPVLGGMGLHYAHFGRLADPAIRATEPEVLVYERRADHMLRLVAVEWVLVDRDQDLGTDDDRPSVLGIPFEGPMVHGPGTPVHYDLHAWIWKHNPTGAFSAWNPEVGCANSPGGP